MQTCCETLGFGTPNITKSWEEQSLTNLSSRCGRPSRRRSVNIYWMYTGRECSVFHLYFCRMLYITWPLYWSINQSTSRCKDLYLRQLIQSHHVLREPYQYKPGKGWGPQGSAQLMVSCLDIIALPYLLTAHATIKYMSSCHIISMVYSI